MGTSTRIPVDTIIEGGNGAQCQTGVNGTLGEGHDQPLFLSYVVWHGGSTGLEASNAKNNSLSDDSSLFDSGDCLFLRLP